MKVLHVTPSFAPAWRYGGPTESVYQLSRHLARQGCEVLVLTTDADGPDNTLDVPTEQEVEIEEGLRVRYCHRVARESVSPTLLRLLPRNVRWADVVHLTAVYSFPTMPTLLAARVFGKPLAWSPRGALQRWEGSTRTGPKAVWELLCRTLRPRTLALHVTSEAEAADVAAKIPGAEVVVIPNGVEVPDAPPRRPPDDHLELLYLGRVHPIKAIDRLVAACKLLDDRRTVDWKLTIAGHGTPEDESALRAQIHQLGLADKISMSGEVPRENKGALFEQTSLTVVPSHTENFGTVVAESLAHGVPVIASKGTPWRRVEEIGCGLWVENSAESLAAAIEQISSNGGLPGRIEQRNAVASPLEEMGRRGREWMEKEYSWAQRTAEMKALYARISSRFDG
jgi:glycosyltransferase involved in cell wall biosynthesis